MVEASAADGRRNQLRISEYRFVDIRKWKRTSNFGTARTRAGPAAVDNTLIEWPEIGVDGTVGN